MSLTILTGDWIERLRELPDESVQCCVTSPPYFSLRDYKMPGQLGLEQTPEEYVAKLVAGFNEVKRVLRSDGVLWLNLGDSYSGSWGNYGGQNRGKGSQRKIANGSQVHNAAYDGLERSRPATASIPGLKPKDLIGIPWAVAFALRADGWYLRSDIIWAKRNCMPESVTDRPTRSHEFIFLLSKSAKYFYDHEAIKEPCIYDVDGTGTAARKARAEGNKLLPTGKVNGIRPGGYKNSVNFDGKNKGAEKQRGHSRRHDGFNDRWDGMEREEQCTGMRNKRDVWTIAPANYPEAHFATFPPDLIKPCILAGTSAKGCCPKCGAPWDRMVVNGEPDLEHQKACGGDKNGDYFGKSTKDYSSNKAQDASATKARILAGMVEKKTVGWNPTCRCFSIEDTPDPIPCTVLDPFAGSGTSGGVALELGRNAVLIELNPDYIELIRQRCNITPGLQLA